MVSERQSNVIKSVNVVLDKVKTKVISFKIKITSHGVHASITCAVNKK
jgi:hypothetical protein